MSPLVTLDTTIGEPVPELAPVAADGYFYRCRSPCTELIGDEPGSDGALNVQR